MNNTYSLFANYRFAAYQYRDTLMRDAFLLRLFIFLLMACASLCGTKAHSATVCIPQGFEVFPSMPTTISLGQITYNGGPKLLYESSVSAAPTSRCSNSPNATLEFNTSYDTTHFNNTVLRGFKGTDTAARVTFMYSSRSAFATPEGLYYSMLFYYYITVDCTGATISGEVVGLNVKVYGLASCRSYTVDYRVSIYQNDTYIPPNNFVSATESNGIRIRTAISADTLSTQGVQRAAISTISGSNTLKLISGVYCTYSLSTSTVDLGTWSSLNLLNSDTSKDYTVNMRNCRNTTGRQVSVFWRFDNPDPSDSSRMLNSIAGGASGVVAQTACAGTVVRHNQPLVISANLQGNLSVDCSAKLVPAAGVSTVGQITPGRFRGIAYLVFQFQ